MSSKNDQLKKEESKKPKALTNEKKFKNLFSDLDSIEIAFLRERVILIAGTTQKSIEEEPEKWQPGIVKSYKNLCEKINTHLGMGEDLFS